MSAATDAAYASVQAFKPTSNVDAMAKSNETYDVGGSQARLSALRGLVDNLTTSVESVDPSVKGRTSGTFTTAGQQDALINKERQPILGSLEKANKAYGQESDTLNSSRGLAASMATALINDDKETYQRLLDQYNASSAKDQSAESTRQFETNLAEQKRQFDVSASQKAASGGSTGDKKTNAISSLISDIQQNVADFRNRPTGWTEKTLLPSLIAEYPELDAKTITDYVYNLRKQYE